MFLGEASRGFTLIVLVFAAMASLLLQIKTKVCLLTYSTLLAYLKLNAVCHLLCLFIYCILCLFARVIHYVYLF